jgi:hypothetical protein
MALIITDLPDLSKKHFLKFLLKNTLKYYMLHYGAWGAAA